MNYDDENNKSQHQVIKLDSSPERTRSPRKQRRANVPRVTLRGRKTQSTSAEPVRRVTPPLATADSRPTTPPLAMDTCQDNPFPIATAINSPLSTAELTLRERNLVIEALRKQVNLAKVADATGIDVERIRKWWIAATTDSMRQR